MTYDIYGVKADGKMVYITHDHDYETACKIGEIYKKSCGYVDYEVEAYTDAED